MASAVTDYCRTLVSIEYCNLVLFQTEFSVIFCIVFLFQGADGRQLRLAGHVGFDSLPDQLVNKSVNRGFAFNILCIGKSEVILVNCEISCLSVAFFWGRASMIVRRYKLKLWYVKNKIQTRCTWSWIDVKWKSRKWLNVWVFLFYFRWNRDRKIYADGLSLQDDVWRFVRAIACTCTCRCARVPFKFRTSFGVCEGKWCKRALLLLILIVIVW